MVDVEDDVLVVVNVVVDSGVVVKVVVDKVLVLVVESEVVNVVDMMICLLGNYIRILTKFCWV